MYGRTTQAPSGGNNDPGRTGSIEPKINPVYPVLRSSMAEYVPDSPISVDSSGPPSPQFEEEVDVLFPYWEWQMPRFFRQEWDELADVLAQEQEHILWLGKQLFSMAHRQL